MNYLKTIRVHKKYFFSILVLLFSTLNLWSQSINKIDTFLLASKKSIYQIKPYVYLSIDTSQLKENNTPLKQSNEIKYIPINQADKILPKVAYVGKIVIKSTLNSDINLGISIGGADLQEITIPDKKISLLTGGYRSKKNNNEIITGSNIVIIPINANSVTEIYLRFKGYNKFELSPVLYDLNYIYQTFKPAETRKIAFQHFFFGSFLLVLIVSILLVLFSLKRTHFYYAIYVLFVGIINSSFDFFLDIFSMSGRYMFFTGEFLGGFAWISYLLFIQSFLETKRSFPFWHKIMNLIIVAATVFIIYIVVTLLVLHNNILYHQFRNIYALIIFILIIPTFSRFVFSKKKLAVIIGSGGLITVMGWIVYLSLQFIDYKDINIVRAGQLFEVLIFGIAIAINVAQVFKENQEVQKQIIFQLEKNKELQEKVNLELEQKVQERTIELMERNQELSMQSEEILSQNEQLEYANKEISKQKEFIELAHKQITNSIIYAKRIQNAVLSRSSTQIYNYHEHFVYFAPKSIVSGDFYYIHQINKKLYLAVADCTGHGVPGAFMSILGITLLDEIIKTKLSNSTSEILDDLRNQVKTSLQQRGQLGEQQDGMDIALCCIDLDTFVLTFAGAYNPCWIFRNISREKQLTILEANKMPIGVYYKEKTFIERSFQLQKNDIIYLFSDGYYSQFGGPRNEKFKMKRFKELLIEISDLPLDIQKETLHNKITLWKGDTNQTDDMMIMGLKI